MSARGLDLNTAKGVVDAEAGDRPPVDRRAQIAFQPSLRKHDDAGARSLDVKRGGVAGKVVVARGDDGPRTLISRDFARLTALRSGKGTAVGLPPSGQIPAVSCSVRLDR